MLSEVEIVEYNPKYEDEWLRVWAIVAVTSKTWMILHHRKLGYKHPSIELVALHKGKLVGFIDVEILNENFIGKSPCGFVWELEVLPEYQGEGIGKRLIQEVINRLRRLNVEILEA